MDENKNINEENGGLEAVIERMQQLFPDIAKETLSEALDAIVKAHPEVDLVELANDELFAKFAADRTDALDAVYDAYLEFSGAITEQIQKKMKARCARSSSSANARTGSPDAGLTQAQREMLAAWNENYPEYAMTGREYMNMLKNA